MQTAKHGPEMEKLKLNKLKADYLPAQSKASLLQSYLHAVQQLFVVKVQANQNRFEY